MIDLLIIAVALSLLIVLAAFGRRLPRNTAAAAVVARVTLGWTIAVSAWSAIAIPLLPVEVLAAAAVQHILLALSAAASLAFAAAALVGR